jgi:hypothetical protein
MRLQGMISACTNRQLFERSFPAVNSWHPLNGPVGRFFFQTSPLSAEAGAKPEHIVRMNWYVVDKKEYVGAHEQLGVIYREIIGRHYPTMTAVQVAGRIEDGARVEIEVTAVIPD